MEFFTRRSTALQSIRGAALVEYGLLVGLVAVVAIGSVSALGSSVNLTFGDVAHSLSASMPSSDANASAETEVQEPVGPVLPAWHITAGRQQDWTGYINPSSGTSFGTLHANTGAIVHTMYDYKDDQMQIRMAGDLRTALVDKNLVCNNTIVAPVSEAIVKYLNTDITEVRWFTTGPARLLVSGQSYECTFSK